MAMQPESTDTASKAIREVPIKISEGKEKIAEGVRRRVEKKRKKRRRKKT